MRKAICIILSIMIISAPMQVFAKKRIEINIPTRILSLYEDNIFIKAYPIAVGKPSSKSPTGHYTIKSKVINPTWAPKGRKPVKPGPSNPLGIRWMGFNKSYGIHGNNNPKSIGTAASGGCIRMNNYDVEELFNLVSIGTPVDIYYNTYFPYKNPISQNSALIVYPDIYNKKVNKSNTINQKLEDIGLNGQVGQEKLPKLFNNVNKKPVVFAKGWSLFINGEFVSADTKVIENKIIDNNETPSIPASDRGGPDRRMVPAKVEPIIVENLPADERVLINVYHINSYLGTSFSDCNSSEALFNGKKVYYKSYDGIPYVSIMDCIRAVNGRGEVDFTQEKISLNLSYGKFNGNFSNLDIKTDTLKAYVWVRDIVNQLGYNSFWDAQKGALIVNGREIKGKMIGGKMYITPKEVNDYFGVDCKYYSLQNKMEITK